MVARILMMPGAACFGGAARENNRGGDGDQAENANPQNMQGSQGCAKHKLPRPNFRLGHRFVRPNYARQTGDLSLRKWGRFDRRIFRAR
jgi:hypothetical protein